MRVFITGSTGLIGRELVMSLVRRGDRAVCLTRSASRGHLLPAAGVDLVEGDPTAPGEWTGILAGCDAVVNLAGESISTGRWTSRRKAEFRRSRIESTRNVAAAVHGSSRVKTLVSASAVGYYGDGGDEPLHEGHDSGSGFLSRLAHEWEGAARTAEGGGARVACARIGLVLSRDGGALPRMLLPYRLGLGGPMGGGRQYVPWIHIADLVAAVIHVLDEASLSGPVNFVAPDPPTQRLFAAALGRALGRPAVLPVPAFVLKMLLGEMSELVLCGQRAVPSALRASGFNFGFGDIDAALTDLLG